MPRSLDLTLKASLTHPPVQRTFLQPCPPLLPHGRHHDLWGGLSRSSEDGHALRPQTEPSTALLRDLVLSPFPAGLWGLGKDRAPKTKGWG